MSKDDEKTDYDLRVDRLLTRAKHLRMRIELLKEADDLWKGGAPLKASFKGLRFFVEALFVSALKWTSTGSRRTRIHRPPASLMNSIARFLYSKKTYERIFMQVVIDLREEHAEALQAKRPWHARWIAARGNLIMAGTMATHAFTSCGKAVVRIWKLTL